MDSVLAVLVLTAHLLITLSILLYIYCLITKRDWKKIIPKSLVKAVEQYHLEIAFFVAMVAMTGSLFYSEVLNYSPCVMCWYQRILMYPQTLILLIAMLVRDHKVYRYIVALSALGFLLAIYHYYGQIAGASFLPCKVGEVSCATKHVFHYGYISIPLMSATAFLLTGFFSYFRNLTKEVNS
jgi:hypothetical protein